MAADLKLPSQQIVGEAVLVQVGDKKTYELKVNNTRPVPQFSKAQVLVRVEACGLCHSDVFAMGGGASAYPRIPGHEIVGTIVAVGTDAKRFKVGDRVGSGWHGGHCFECNRCFKGDHVMCANEKINGLTNDGGYCEYVALNWEACCVVPKELTSAQAAPLMCAGVTVFNALRNAGIKPGSVVAVQGIGGLGHYAIQFARACGYYTVALSGSSDKAQLAKDLGAHVFLDSSKQNLVEELKKLGGASLILATGYDAKIMSDLSGALAKDGKLVVLGVDSANKIQVDALSLILGRNSVCGWPSGTAADSEDTLLFASRFGIKSMIEEYPLAQAETAYQRMLSNKARFRVVLVTPAASSK